eukprot:13631935-Heterocapsa_arctica.AAC.1
MARRRAGGEVLEEHADDRLRSSPSSRNSAARRRGPRRKATARLARERPHEDLHGVRRSAETLACLTSVQVPGEAQLDRDAGVTWPRRS